MNNNSNKSRDIFMGVVAVATLIVAIVGATLAYFSITASSNEGAVNATAAIVSIEYNDGKQVTAQANALIPADFESVVQDVYEKKVLVNTEVFEDISKASNLCIDSNGREVCSVYRFTIYSDVERQITATLNTESNGFEHLRYAVYDVDNKEWIKLDSEDTLSSGIKKCSNDDEDVVNCHNIEDGMKKYTPDAINSIFGIADINGTLKKGTVDSKNEDGHAYDIVLYINETGTNQNIDQGKQYNGTINIEVDGGLNGSNGNITGCVGNDCKE